MMKSEGMDVTMGLKSAYKKRYFKKGVSVVLLIALILSFTDAGDRPAFAKTTMHTVNDADSDASSLRALLKACFDYAINNATFISSFNTAESTYVSSSGEVISKSQSLDVGSTIKYTEEYAELRTLVGLAKTVTDDIAKAQALKAGSTGITENTYPTFANYMSTISNSSGTGSLDIYLAKYTELMNKKLSDGSTKPFATALPSSDDAYRLFLIDSSSYIVNKQSSGAYYIGSNSTGVKSYTTWYKALKQMYDIEEAYITLRSTIGSDSQLKANGITEDTLSELSEFSSVVSENGGTTTVNSLNKYNGAEILALLQK